MLEGLDQIDWYKLGHAYGDASDVPAMIRSLASKKKATRDKAWDDLFGSVRHQGSIYSATPRVVPFLIELLGEPSVPAKAEFLQNLCGYAPDYGYWEPYYGEEEPPGLDTHPTRTAIEAGMPIYATFLNDADPAVRSWAARLLTVCFRQRDVVARTLRAHILAERDLAVRVACVFQLAILNRSSDGRFFASLGRDDRSPLVHLAASLARVHLRPEKPPADAVAVIERAAKSSRDLLSQLPKDERVVDVALEAVAKRPAGVRSLLAMAKSGTVAVRKDAVQKLSSLNPCPPEAVRGMVRALGDSNAELRRWTAFLLGEFGTDAIRFAGFSRQPLDSVALEARLAQVAPVAVAGLLARLPREKNNEVRDALFRALKDLALWAPSAIPVLRPFDGNHDADEALTVIETLQSADPAELVKLVDDIDEKVSWMAGRVLVRVGRERSGDVVPLLTERLSSWPAAVEKAAHLLGELGPAAAPALPALREALKNLHQGARNAAEHAIRLIDPSTKEPEPPGEAEVRRKLGASAPAELVPWVVRLLDDGNTGGQWGALWAIAQMESAARPAIPFVREAMAKEWLYHDAAGALARLDPDAVRPMLPELLRDFETARLDGDFRERALAFLAYLGPELQPDAVAFLLRCLPEPGQPPRIAAGMIPCAIDYLVNAGPDVLLPLLIRLLETRWEADRVGVFCSFTPVLKLLKQQGAGYAGAVPAVAAILDTARLLPLTLETLSRIGSWTTVLPLVVRFIESKDKAVRKAAEECVKRLGTTAVPSDVPALQTALSHRAAIVKRAARTALDRLSSA